MALPNDPKWDWQLIQALYLGGMEQPDILKLPRFEGLSKSYLAKRVSEGRWKEKRDAAIAEGAGQIALPLQQRMNQAVQIHQAWLLGQLEHERRIFGKRLKTGNTQTERLESLRRIDDLTRKLLGMDAMKPVNNEQRNLAVIIAMQNGTTAQFSVTMNEGDGAKEEKKIEGRDLTAEVQELFRQSQLNQALDKEPALPVAVREIAGPKFKDAEPALVNENEGE